MDSWGSYLAFLTGYADVDWDDSRPYITTTRFVTWYMDATSHVVWEELSQQDLDTWARAYILILLSAMFSDANLTTINLTLLVHIEDLDTSGRLSWGSAALAYLYRHMCRYAVKDLHTLTGPLVILQVFY